MQAMAESGGFITKYKALLMTSSNIEKLLGVDQELADDEDQVAVQGGSLLSFEGKVVGVVSPHQGIVDLF